MKAVRSSITRWSLQLAVGLAIAASLLMLPTATFAQTQIGLINIGGSAPSAGSAAVSGLGGSAAADALCNPVLPACPCNQVVNPNPNGPKCIAGSNMFMCYCSQTQNGVLVGGMCTAPMHCQATSVGGVSGGSGSGVSSLGQLAQALGQALGSLLSQSGSGSGSGSSGSTATTGTTGCTTAYYYTSNTALIGVDPCAIYQASASTGTVTNTSTTGSSTCSLESELDGTCNSSTGSSGVNVSSSTVNTLTNGGSTTSGGTASTGGTSGNDTGSSVANTSGNGSGTTNSNSGSNLGPGTANNISISGDGSDNGSPIAAEVTGVFNPDGSSAGNTPGIPLGATGTIQTTGTGATFTMNEEASGTALSLFFGSNSLTGLVNTIVIGWCESRPWASGLISQIISPTFFDGLCQQFGYPVGPQAAPSETAAPAGEDNVSLSQTPVEQNSTQPSQVVQVIATTTSVIPGRVDIWAVPPTVPLGARTTIFWNTENVTDCTESSPDGSFSESSLTGGAATVPLTQPTTYTISCIDSENNPVTGYVSVGISN